MKGLLKTILPDKNALKTFAVLGGANLVVLAAAFATKFSDDAKGYVSLPWQGSFETRQAFKSEGSKVYDACNVRFMATPRGGVGSYTRPLTMQESNYVNQVEMETK